MSRLKLHLENSLAAAAAAAASAGARRRWLMGSVLLVQDRFVHHLSLVFFFVSQHFGIFVESIRCGGGGGGSSSGVFSLDCFSFGFRGPVRPGGVRRVQVVGDGRPVRGAGF